MNEMINAWDRITGWSKVPDPITEIPGKRDWDKAVAAAGFLSWIDTASDGGSAWIEFHICRHADDRFLVRLDTWSDGAYVLIPDVASMLEFLRLYAPVIQMSFMCGLRELLTELHPLLTDPDHGLLRDQVCGIEQRRRDQVEYYKRKRQEVAR